MMVIDKIPSRLLPSPGRLKTNVGDIPLATGGSDNG